MEDKYLPIGSIVLLKDDIVMHMITGYLNKDNNTKEYTSIPFPYGLMTDKIMYNFNHDDIENILFLGYKNDKYEELNLILNGNN